MPADRYHFAYAENSPYGHIVSLLRQHAHVPGGLVIDIGCGYGAIAEPVADLELRYVGVDLEKAGIDDLRRRGFEGAVVDLRDPEVLAGALAAIVDGRPLAAICALDVIEHLTNGPAVLQVLHDLAVANQRPPLFVSIPNVTHIDLAAKLLVGRWDVTPTGLLDETHVALYSPSRLKKTFESCGWCEIGEADFELVHSDQHFPADSPVLAPTPLHDLLAKVRRRAGPGATTNQFVRAYAPVAVVAAEIEDAVAPGPFLSVLVTVTEPDAAGIEDVLVALEAQLCTDFELLVLVERASKDGSARLKELLGRFRGGLADRARVVALDLSGNEVDARLMLLTKGIHEAKGRYVVQLDEGCVVFSHFVATLLRLEKARPGAVLRVLGATQELHRCTWPDGSEGYEPTNGARPSSTPAFSFIDHLFEEGSPPETTAIPSTCFTELGIAHDRSLGSLAHHGVFLAAVEACGIAEEMGAVAVLRRRFDDQGNDLPNDKVDQRQRERLEAGLDGAPLLLPRGSITALRERLSAPGKSGAVDAMSALADEAVADAVLVRERDEIRAELEALRASTSWKVTAPLRRVTRRLHARNERSAGPRHPRESGDTARSS